MFFLLLGSYAVLFSAFLPPTGLYVGAQLCLSLNFSPRCLVYSFWTCSLETRTTSTFWCYLFQLGRILSSQIGSAGSTIGILDAANIVVLICHSWYHCGVMVETSVFVPEGLLSRPEQHIPTSGIRSLVYLGTFTLVFDSMVVH